MAKRRSARSNPEMTPPVTIDQVELFSALGVLKHVADMKSSYRALSHVLLEGAGGEVLATTTDLRCMLSALLRGEGEGTYLLPVKQLTALVEPESKPKKGKKGASRPATDVRLYVDPEDMTRRHEDYKAELARYKERLEKYRVAKAEADAKQITYIPGYGDTSTPPEKPSPSMVKTRLETPDLTGSLIGLGAGDFPNRPRIRWEKTTEIDVEQALDAFSWVLPSVSTDEGRPFLNSLLVDPEAGLVATDGHRLLKTPFAYEGEQLQLPLTALEHFLRLMKLAKTGTALVSTGGTVRVKALESAHSRVPQWVLGLVPYARFDVGVWSLVAKLTDPSEARFPPFEKVIPEFDRSDRTVVVRVSAEKAAATVKRLEKIMGGRHSVLLTVAPSGAKLEWECDDPDAGGAKIETPAVFSQRDITEPFRVGFVGTYMIDALSGMSDEVTISFAGPADAIRVDSDNGRLAIVMPMRL